MNITLIRPPAYSAGLMGAQLVPFLGIAYIAAAAKKAGHNVDIIDMCGEDIVRTEIIRNRYVAYGMSFSSLKERIKPSTVIGFTCMFSQDWVFHKELIQHVHRLFPESILVAGGEHISALPEYCLDDCPELDICITGEGEEVFVKLLDAIERKSNLSEVPSLVYREKGDNNYCRTPRARRIQDIDNIPLPAWELIPMENYLSRGLTYHILRGRTIPMLATRGCPYKCTFCSNPHSWGSPWVARNPALVINEIEYYIKHYKVNNIVFSDLAAVVTPHSMVKMCHEILNRGIKITWQIPALRTEALDYNLMNLMFESGCKDLDFAIESGSNRILNSVSKRNNPTKIVYLIKDGLRVGMNMSSNIIVGLPRERFSDFLKSYWLVIKLAFIGLQEINVFPFVPYPGSKLFKDLLVDKKITVNDEYLYSLFGFADLGRAVSWSPYFGPRTLSFMRLILLASFYGVMFISHPLRIVRLIINAARGKTTTKFEAVLKRLIRNVLVYFS